MNFSFFPEDGTTLQGFHCGDNVNKESYNGKSLEAKDVKDYEEEFKKGYTSLYEVCTELTCQEQESSARKDMMIDSMLQSLFPLPKVKAGLVLPLVDRFVL
jgi:hypothetical protein